MYCVAEEERGHVEEPSCEMGRMDGCPWGVRAMMPEEGEPQNTFYKGIHDDSELSRDVLSATCTLCWIGSCYSGIAHADGLWSIFIQECNGGGGA